MESTITTRRRFRFTESAKEGLAFLIILICLFLFLISAYTKIEDHERFASGLAKIQFIGVHAALISWVVPIAEIAISLLLIIPYAHRWGLYAFASLMIVFTVYILSMLLWEEKLPCHCNLIIEKLSWTAHLWFNLGFIVLALCALWLMKKQHS
ncbi:MauE/DoxX family redox-associated membrane protein [Pedobacter antarcticus]|uniref:MauE/DoxX family redox-associated membrane protein n=1 Tax=Pedobacter antarcticus TaxID=34086 RepID=UPI00292F2E25|nr:MauE/DoxX family redox-associated membrane protein [Pedobacter antarcticus]